MSNMHFLWELTIVIPWLPSLFRMATAVSFTVKSVNSVTSDSVGSFNFAMWAPATKWFPIELGQWSYWWRKNLMRNDTYDASAAGLLNCTVQIQSPWRSMSRVFPSNRTLQVYIHWSTPSITYSVQSKDTQIMNQDKFIFGRYHNL